MAFSEFVDRHENALLSFASAVLRDETLAQDVVQEAFLRVARHPERIRKHSGTPEGARNWLLKVVRDLSIDSLRRKASERRALDGIALVSERAAPSADSVLEGREEVQRTWAAIDRLRPRLRELLILKIREKRSYREIAEITGLTVTNVGFLLHQAMQDLQTQLKEKDRG